MTTTNKVLELDNAYAWDIQVRTIDKLETTTVSLVVSVGIPIFRIGTDGYVYNNEKRLIPEDELPRYSTHVGQVIMSTTLSTAAAVGFVRLNVPVIITTRTMPKKCGTFLSIRTGNFVWCPYRGWV